ncbi:MAG TPA: YebC/PmpR family DNA-binding transcriptional regulator [Allocoleopsis sp.]
MAGHSKWANIKRQKARIDAKKGKTFTQLSRAIIVNARNGADPAGNFQLRTAIEKAKAAGIPNDNIEKAIAKGSGSYDSGNNYEYIRYEGYGVGGVAILVEVLTDNRNRSAASLRLAFSKNGGNLGETGCVGWMFSQKGVCILEGDFSEDVLLEVCIETDADNYEIIDDEDSPGAEIFTSVENLENLSLFLKNKGFNVIESALRWLPDNTLEITDLEQGRSLFKLIDTLESLDDVQSVTSNLTISDDLTSLIM